MALSTIQPIVMGTMKAEMESTTTDQALWLQNWEAKKWSEVDDNGVSGMVFIHDPVVVSVSDNKVHCFAVAPDGYLHHKRFIPSTGWSDWVSLGKRSNCAPIAINYTGDKVAVFFVGYDNLAYGGLSTSDTTFTWKAVGDGIKKIREGSLSACVDDGWLVLVAVELFNGQVTHTWANSSLLWHTGWDGWAGFCLSTPVIVSCKPKCRDIFIIGESRNLLRMTLRYGASGWSGWQNCGGQYAYEPTAVSVSPGRIDVFGIGLDGQLYQTAITLSGMEIGSTPTTVVGGISISSPKISITSPGVFSVTTKKAKGVYQQKFYESSSGVWTPQDGMTVVL